MFDTTLGRLLAPALDRAGRLLAARSVSPDLLTGLGLAFGLACATAVAAGADALALAALAAGRVCDGLDGAVARASRPSDRGGFLDILCDFVFYGAVPLAFALRDSPANAVAAATLLFAFYVNGASVLAFAALAAKRGLDMAAGTPKAVYFSRGLMEGGETIVFFAAMMLWPRWFPVLALAFAGLTLMGALSRATLAWHVFRDDLPVDKDGV